MSSMRWGDSDSSDEDEIRVSSLPVPGIRDDSPPRLPPRRPSGPARSSGHARSSGRDRPTSSSKSSSRTPDRNRRQPPQKDWKEMAKSSSRFAPTVTNQQAPLDGSAWMAQRQKKLEEQGERERMDMERRKKEEEEEKRSRRKSQFDALKAAVKEIEASSSLQAAAAQKRHEPQAPPAPTRILTRPSDQTPKDQNKVLGNDIRKENDQKPSSVQKLHDRRPASPDHSAEDEARSIKSASTTSSRKRNEGRGGRGRRASRSRGRNSDGGRSMEGTRVSTSEGSRRDDRHRDTHGRSGKDDVGRSARHGGGNRDHGGRSGRGRASGRVKVGSTQKVRTSSGNIEYHVTLDDQEKETKGELLPNGTVRLSRKKKGGRGHGSPKHTSIQTKLEIGKEEK